MHIYFFLFVPSMRYKCKTPDFTQIFVDSVDSLKGLVYFAPPCITSTSQPQSITAHWLVLTAFTHRGMARLSRSGGWLHTDKNFTAMGAELADGHPSNQVRYKNHQF